MLSTKEIGSVRHSFGPHSARVTVVIAAHSTSAGHSRARRLRQKSATLRQRSRVNRITKPERMKKKQACERPYFSGHRCAKASW